MTERKEDFSVEETLAKKWFVKCLVTILALLALVAAVIIIVDPYFH